MKNIIYCLVLTLALAGGGLVMADDQPASAGPTDTAASQPGPATPEEGSSEKRTDQIIRSIWEKLYSAQFSENTPGCSFDYGPNGMRNIYCYFSPVISYTDLLSLAGLQPFTSGPHTEQQLDLNSRNDFGHYNPEFVTWLNDHLIPAVGDENFKWISDPLYQRYLKRTARTYYLVSDLLFGHQSLLEQQTEKYRQVMAGAGMDYVYFPEVSTLFKKEYIDQYLDGDYYYYNVVDAAAGFWLRRYMDGTSTLFQAGLNKLLAAYDQDFLDNLGASPSSVAAAATPATTTPVQVDDPILKKMLAQFVLAVEEHDWPAVLVYFEPENYSAQTKTGQTTPRYIMEGLGLGLVDNQLIPLPNDQTDYALLNAIKTVTIEKVGPPDPDGLVQVSGQVTLFDGSQRRLEFPMIRTSTGGYLISPALG